MRLYMNKLRTIFMGSPAIACKLLETVRGNASCDVVGVVTQPDRPKGRNLNMAPCDIKKKAVELGLLVLDPANINSPESVAVLQDLKPDLYVVLAYGQILKKAVLSIPRLGPLNIHASLLPKYRGAAPIQWAIANGEKVTGVTAMLMNEKMDAGDILAMKEVAIADDDDCLSLSAKLEAAGCEVIKDVVSALASGTVTGQRQIESDATYAAKLKKEDGLIDWNWPAEKICNRVRAFNPWPSCYCITHIHGVKILKVHKAVRCEGNGKPGQVIGASGEGLIVAAGQHAVGMIEVQEEGRKRMSGADWAIGSRLKPGMMIAG